MQKPSACHVGKIRHRSDESSRWYRGRTIKVKFQQSPTICCERWKERQTFPRGVPPRPRPVVEVLELLPTPTDRLWSVDRSRIANEMELLDGRAQIPQC